MNIGDAISNIATPFARMFNLPCIDPNTGSLRPDSPCAKRKSLLNQGRFADAFYTFFEADKIRKLKGTKTMLFIVTKQIQIEAETPEQAVANSNEGQTVAISVSAKPQQQTGK